MQRRNYLMGILIAILLVVDVGLIAYAMRPGPTTADVVNPAPSASASADEQAEPEPSSSSTGDQAVLDVDVAPLTRFIVATNEDTAWAASSDECGKPGKVSNTRQQGQAWTEYDLPGSVTRLRAQDNNTAFVGGGETDCKLARWNTEDSGKTWKSASVSDLWVRDPKSPDTVHTPKDKSLMVCDVDVEVIDLSPITNDVAYVLCAGGEVRLTQDKGDTWTPSFKLSTAIAISATDENTVFVAAAAESGCSGGVTVLSYSKGKAAGKAGCAKAPATPGLVALSAIGSGVWILADNQVYRADKFNGAYKKVTNAFK